MWGMLSLATPQLAAENTDTVFKVLQSLQIIILVLLVAFGVCAYVFRREPEMRARHPVFVVHLLSALVCSYVYPLVLDLLPALTASRADPSPADPPLPPFFTSLRFSLRPCSGSVRISFPAGAPDALWCICCRRWCVAVCALSINYTSFRVSRLLMPTPRSPISPFFTSLPFPFGLALEVCAYVFRREPTMRARHPVFVVHLLSALVCGCVHPQY